MLKSHRENTATLLHKPPLNLVTGAAADLKTTGGSAQGIRFFTDANNCGTSMTGVRSFGFGVRCMKDEAK